MSDHQDCNQMLSPPAEGVTWALINTLREGIVQLDDGGHIELINRAACDLLGASGETARGQVWEAVCDHCMSNGRRYPTDQSPIRLTLADNRERRIEGDRFVGLNGISRVVRYDCLPVNDASRSGLVLSFVDTTAELLTEQLHTWEASILTLMSGGARRSAMMKAILNGLDILTPGGQSAVVLLNARTQQPERVFASSLSSVDREALLTASPDVMHEASTERWSIELSVGGVHAYLYCFGLGQLDEKRPERRVLERAVSLIHLALEQDRAYRLREDNEQRFKQLALHVSEVFWMAERDGSLSYVSPAFERVWGIPVATLYRQPWIWLDRIVQEDRSRVIKAQSLQASGHYQIEYRITGPDGRLRWIEDQAFPVRDRAGTVKRIVGTARDITNRKASDQRISDLVSDLRRSNDELQSFASIVSHDLQEPLRKIQMFSERLQSDSLPLTERQAHFLERMHQASLRMRNLIQALLGYARLSAIDEPMQTIDLSEVVDDVLMDLELRLNEAGAEITRGPLPVIQGRSSQWRQVMLNLINNAVKFRRPGVPLHLDIRGGLSAGKRQQVSVADNGLGFEVARHPDLFKPFYRIPQSEDVEGTGIGLAIVSKVLSQHGLSIHVSSAPGEGSRFVIEWPDEASMRSVGTMGPSG